MGKTVLVMLMTGTLAFWSLGCEADQPGCGTGLTAGGA